MCQMFLRNTGGKWASNMLAPVFLAQGRFLGVPFLHLVAAGHAEQTKKKQKKKKKKKKTKKEKKKKKNNKKEE